MRYWLCISLALAPCAGASAAEPAAPPKEGKRCEDAVGETSQTTSGKIATKTSVTEPKRSITATGEDELSVKGEGRYLGANGNVVPFGYSCAYNSRSGETSGAAFRELSATAAARPAPDGRNAPWQPDLAKLSPEACESAVAAALKDRHPQAEHIIFGAETRRLQPAAEARTALEGQGTVQRGPGLVASLFSYRCEFDPVSGKLESAQSKD